MKVMQITCRNESEDTIAPTVLWVAIPDGYTMRTAPDNCSWDVMETDYKSEVPGTDFVIEPALTADAEVGTMADRVAADTGDPYVSPDDVALTAEEAARMRRDRMEDDKP